MNDDNEHLKNTQNQILNKVRLIELAQDVTLIEIDDIKNNLENIAERLGITENIDGDLPDPWQQD